jgi:xanthine dehydrogenase accessory factor
MSGSEAPTFYEQVVALERAGTGFVIVMLVEALGSTPQDAGTKIIVTREGLLCGTIGGGKVEAKAIDVAREMLGNDVADPRFVNWALKGDVGMTCGGSVKLYFEPHLAGGAGAAWPVWIFGAGHVVQALLPLVAPLDCRITVVDARREWLDRLPRARNVRYIESASPEKLVDEMPDNAFLLCLGKGHASDRPILERALSTRSFPFVGVIGSASKAAILQRELTDAGVPEKRAREFHCPVGLPFGSNHPHEIALSIAAQLVSERDKQRPIRET